MSPSEMSPVWYKIILAGTIYVEYIFSDQNYKHISHDRNLNNNLVLL